MEAKNTREKEEEAEEKEEVEMIKRRISTHPLYGLLLEAHLGCLKVGEIGELDRNQSIDQKNPENKPSLGMVGQSELDHFMETYCLALSKLKEAMEEPQQNSMTFINNMQSQLRELTISYSAPGKPDSSSSSTQF